MSEQDRAVFPEGKGQLEREAAQWCVRMHGEDAERQRPIFEDWLRRGALHREAYNRIEEVYLLGGRLRRYDEVPERTDRRPDGEHVIRHRLLAGMAALALLAIGGAASYLFQSRDRVTDRAIVASTGSIRQTLSTAANSRDFALPDGSRISLAPSSLLTLSFDTSARNLSLLSGRGRFSVAHEYRPFVVQTVGGSVTATGTIFEVGIERATVDVHLIEGSVIVAPASSIRGSLTPLRRLHAGERISVASVIPSAPDRTVAAAPAASQQPQTVGELVDRANEGSRGGPRIEVPDRALRDTRLSGVFRVHDPETTAERLAAVLDLNIDRSDMGVIRLVRRAPR